MAGLPINIPIPAESAVANYDWTDIVNGLGYVTFYPMCVGIAGGTFEAVLSTQALRPCTGTALPYNYYGLFKAGAPGGTTQTISCDTTPFVYPRLINGNAFFSFAAKSDANNVNQRITTEVFFVRGGAETSIGSSVDSGDIFATETNRCHKIVLTKTLFQIGDILRLKITMVTLSNVNMRMGANPVGTASVELTQTQSVLQIPIKIDL